MDRLLYRIAEAGAALGSGRTKTYALIAAGELPIVRIGSSVRVPVDKLREYIDRKTAEHARPVRTPNPHAAAEEPSVPPTPA